MLLPTCQYRVFVASAIKTGRYTHDKRTRDIKEVKRLQHVEKLRQGGFDPATAPHPGASPERLSPVPSIERRRSPKAAAARRVEPTETFTKSGLSAAELDAMVEHITEVHRQHTPHTAEFFAMLPQKEKEFLVSSTRHSRKLPSVLLKITLGLCWEYRSGVSCRRRCSGLCDRFLERNT